MNELKNEDFIELSKVSAATQLGVPDLERGEWQTVSVSAKLFLKKPLRDLGDNLENTVDYSKIATEVRQACSQKPRFLLETLAEDIARQILCQPLVARVEVRVEKFVLPGVESAAVFLCRSAQQ